MPATDLDQQPIIWTTEQLERRLRKLEQTTYGLALCSLELARACYKISAQSTDTKTTNQIKQIGLHMKGYIEELPDHF
jgi:hypothetical protein